MNEIEYTDLDVFISEWPNLPITWKVAYESDPNQTPESADTEVKAYYW